MFSISFEVCQIKTQKSRIFFHEAFSSVNRKLIFKKIRFLKKNLKIEKQLYITIILMDCHQNMSNQN